MTGADLLTRMQVIANELEIASGGDDETKCLAALDMAQDYFEDVAASMPRIGQTKTTVTTAADTETTSLPSGLLRLDSVWYIDATTSRPAWEVLPITDTGGHRPQSPWPFNLVMTPGTGAPRRYAYDSENFYWLPEPDAVYTLRVQGLFSKTALTSRSTTFGWPDSVSVPIAAFAVRLLETSIDDPSDDVSALAEEAFVPVLRRLRKLQRQAPMGRHYTHMHVT